MPVAKRSFRSEKCILKKRMGLEKNWHYVYVELAVRQSLNKDVNSPSYLPDRDLDGSGRIDALDLAALRRAQAAQPPPAASVTAWFFGAR